MTSPADGYFGHVSLVLSSNCFGEGILKLMNVSQVFNKATGICLMHFGAF
jgi:hypothetical protein